MKKVFLCLMFAMFANVLVAEVVVRPPKRHQGFDYSKHYRKSRRITFFNRTLNLSGCYGHYKRR